MWTLLFPFHSNKTVVATCLSVSVRSIGRGGGREKRVALSHGALSPGQWWPHGPCQAGGATHSGVTQPRGDNPPVAPGPGPVPEPEADKLENLAAPGRGGSQHCVAHLAPHSSEGWETCAGIELWVTWTKCSLALDKVRTPVSAV